MKQAVLENHNKYCERRDLFKSFGYDIEEERKFILDAVMPVSGRILEVGIGKGHSSVALAKKGHSLISIDISEEEQAFARLNLEYFYLLDRVDLRIMDAEHLAFEEGSFDVIFSVNAVHHFRDVFKVTDELTRVMAPAGKIILCEFSEEGFQVVDRVHARDGRTHATGKKGLDDIADYLQGKGYEVEKKSSRFQEILIIRKMESDVRWNR